MKKILFACTLTLTFFTLSAQEIILTFQSEGQNNNIDSIWATNLTTKERVKLLANDSLILTKISGLYEIPNSNRLIYPNPCNGNTRIFLNVKTNENVNIRIYSVTGQIVSSYKEQMSAGENIFNLRFPGNGIYIISAQINGETTCRKVICLDTQSQESLIEFEGISGRKELKKGTGVKTLGYSPTNIIHYLVYSENNQTVFTDSPSASKNYKVEFYECASVDSRSYKTVKIGDQIWMAENLAYLPNVSLPSEGSNSDPYYYVYGYRGTDVVEAKTKKSFQDIGVLYNRTAALKVCPDGWHLPSDLEWEKLAQFVNDQKGPFERTDIYWYDVGKYLKARYGWSESQNGTDDFAFSGQPGGQRTRTGAFQQAGQVGFYWSSTEYFGITSWFWDLRSFDSTMGRNTAMNEIGFSVRCIKDSK